MAIKQIPVIDATEATQNINYAEGEGGGLIQVVQLDGSTLPNERALPVKVVGANKVVRTLTADPADPVPAGASITVTVSPPASAVAKVMSLYTRINAPAGATSGTHSLILALGWGAASPGRYLHLDAPYDEALSFTGFGVTTDTTFAEGAGVSGVEDWLRLLQIGLFFTPALPLYIRYINNTDADQTGSRSIRLNVFEEAGIS